MTESERMAAALKQLEDAAVVTAALMERHARVMRDHAEWLVAHDKGMAEMRERGKLVDDRIEKLGERIEKLVSGIGEYMRRPGNGDPADPFEP